MEAEKRGEERRASGITVYITIATCVVFSIMLGIIALISYSMYKDAFYDYSNEQCLSSNAQAAYLIDGDQVARYARTLEIDAEYEAFAARMDELRERINAKYFYIMADTGVDGMYTYIYDAMGGGEEYRLGEMESKDVYEGAEEVLSAGQGFKQALYYNDYYGELYYAYSPILDASGAVVAFVGTDIDISPLHTQLSDYQNVLVLMGIVAFVVFFGMFSLIIQRVLTTPMRAITDTALRISEGDLRLRISGKTQNGRDEISALARAFASMARSMGDVVDDIETIMRAVRNGFLGDRIDLTPYQGDYHRIISGVNTTLDVVCRHFDAVPEAIAFLGPDEEMRYHNAAMAKCADAHGLDMRGAALLRGLLAGGDARPPVHREIALPGPDGAPSVYALTLLRTDDGMEGEGGCLMLMLSDVTAVTQAKDQAVEASHAKSDFLSRMSHEIRTPMNAIVGLSQIAKDASDVDKIKSCLTKIEDSSAHLLGIINDILDFSKIEAGKMVLEEALFSLSEDMGFIRTMIAPRAKERGIRIVYEAENIAHDGVYADSLRLNQVLINLLTNAVKFSRDGGEILLRIEETGHADGVSAYRFTVRDYGIGISEAQIARLFQPFEQGDASTTRRYGGTGLGLAISKNIVALMGGEIAVESEPGKGSAFAFTIHVRAQESAALAEDTGGETREETLHVRFDGKRALVVDDIEINREIILELLAATGLAMETAEDGAQALAMFEQSAAGYYDVILMDMQMPVMDGCTATERIRALARPDARTVKIIAMTANVMREDVERSLAAGMDGHLGKPIDVKAVERMLGDMLGGQA